MDAYIVSDNITVTAEKSDVLDVLFTTSGTKYLTRWLNKIPDNKIKCYVDLCWWYNNTSQSLFWRSHGEGGNWRWIGYRLKDANKIFATI